MPVSGASNLKPFVLTLTTLLLATAARMTLTPLVGDQYPFITYFPAVAVVGRYAGFRFSIASVVLSALSAAMLFFHPPLTEQVTSGDIAGLGLFLVLGFFIAWLTKQERDAREAATRSLEAVKQHKRASEEQAALLDLAHDAIMALRLDGTIEFWNRGAEEMYGYSADQAQGRVSHDLLKTVFPKPLQQIQQELLNRGSWEGELIHTRTDGKQIYVSSRWGLRRTEGAPTGFLEITRDITERRKLDEQLRQTAKLESLGVLAGGIAHDFNNLLVGIMGNASLTSPGPSKSGLRDSAVSQIHDTQRVKEK
jgi:PAS domain S-box-containing protein